MFIKIKKDNKFLSNQKKDNTFLLYPLFNGNTLYKWLYPIIHEIKY